MSDYGLATKLDDEVRLKYISGTPGFIPGELALASKKKYDLFSLGYTFHHLGMLEHLPASLGQRMTASAYKTRPAPADILKEIADALMKPASDRLVDLKKRRDEAQAQLESAKLAYERAHDKLSKVRATSLTFIDMRLLSSLTSRVAEGLAAMKSLKGQIEMTQRELAMLEGSLASNRGLYDSAKSRRMATEANERVILARKDQILRDMKRVSVFVQ